MKTFQIHGQIKIKANGNCEAIINIVSEKNILPNLNIIKASSTDLLFDGMRKFFEKIEKRE